MLGVRVSVTVNVVLGVRVGVRVAVAVGTRVSVGVTVGAAVPICGYMDVTPAMSSLPRQGEGCVIGPAHRPSKCAMAAIVAVGSVECPKPMVWPISWVATSAKLI